MIPFYIQWVIQDLKFIFNDGNIVTITKSTIDRVFNEILEQRQYFEHWHTRLRITLAGNDYNFFVYFQKALFLKKRERPDEPDNACFDPFLKKMRMHQLKKFKWS